MNVYPRPSASKVAALLFSCGLPNADITQKELEHFFGCGTESDPSGVVGVELYGEAGLLRSLAVTAAARGKGCGRRLVGEAERYAALKGVRYLYLLTTTAESFFDSLGYGKVERGSVPDAIRNTTEFVTGCPDTAAVMMKAL